MDVSAVVSSPRVTALYWCNDWVTQALHYQHAKHRVTMLQELSCDLRQFGYSFHTAMVQSEKQSDSEDAVYKRLSYNSLTQYKCRPAGIKIRKLQDNSF